MNDEKIGRYEVVGRLGRGGMSSVYKARAPVTGRLVALKILQPKEEIFVDLVGEKRLQEIFIEEARVMGELSDDHVAKIIDCDQHQGQPFIVLEYFAHSIGSFIGESYRVERPSRVISAARTKSYLLQALRGLERLHFAGIIHRDLKPYNMMITSDDRIKIIDFGLSRVRGEEKMAIPGMQVGSPYYAAPEQEKILQQPMAGQISTALAFLHTGCSPVFWLTTMPGPLHLHQALTVNLTGSGIAIFREQSPENQTIVFRTASRCEWLWSLCRREKVGSAPTVI